MCRTCIHVKLTKYVIVRHVDVNCVISRACDVISILHVYKCDTCFIVIYGTLKRCCYQNFEMTSHGATYDAIDVIVTHYDALCQFYMYTVRTCFTSYLGRWTRCSYQNFDMTSQARLMTQLTSTWRTMTHFVNFTCIHVRHMFYSHIWDAEHDAAIKISIWRRMRDLWRNWLRCDAAMTCLSASHDMTINTCVALVISGMLNTMLLSKFRHSASCRRQLRHKSRMRRHIEILIAASCSASQIWL